MTDESFDREKICYEQNYAQFRSLNNIMWQIPIIAMTLTGGAWYAVANLNGNILIQMILLALAAIGNVGLIVIISRIRFVISKYLDSLENFHPSGYVNAKGGAWYEGSKVVVRTFSAMMFLAAIGSILAICILVKSPKSDTSNNSEIIIWVD